MEMLHGLHNPIDFVTYKRRTDPFIFWFCHRVVAAAA